MTVSSAYYGGSQNPNSSQLPSSGYADRSGNQPNSGSITYEAWSGQTGTLQGSSVTPYWQSAVTSHTNYEHPEWTLFDDFVWSPAISAGAIITDISATIGRVQGNGTNASKQLFDWVVQLIVYNGSDLTSGWLGSNLAATTTAWPAIAGTSPTSGNFANATYDFGAAATYSQVTNSNFGLVLAIDGSLVTATSNSDPFLCLVQLSVTWTAGGDTDDSGAIGSQASTMNAGGAFIASEDNTGAAVGYRLKEPAVRKPRIWTPPRRLLIPAAGVGRFDRSGRHQQPRKAA